MKKISVFIIIVTLGLIVLFLNGVTGDIPGIRALSFSSQWLSSVSAFSQDFQWPWHMRDYGYGRGMMGYYWFGGFIMWIIIILVIALLVYLIIRARRPEGTDRTFQETPLDILKKRYAKGDITKEEFDEIRKNIES
jgi:putative membrane protein